MYSCSGCGVKLTESFKFCPKCGQANTIFQDNNQGNFNKENKEHSSFRHKKDKPSDYNEENLLRKYDVKYLGGHKAYPKSTDTKMLIYQDKMEIENLFLTIPYSRIINIENLDAKKITAKRFILVGVFALAWKKKVFYTIIEYNDGNITHNMIFDFGKDIDEIQPLIYQKILESKK